MQLSRARIDRFRREVKRYYARHGRTLAWRKTRSPYKILISEVMLQQTQVARVMDIYPRFIRVFPNFNALARAPLRNILKEWQGMGYNRRAVYAKRAAEVIIKKYNGTLPKNEEALRALPGIGPATAASVLAFAFNQPSVFIETNIRAVFIHHFFPRRHAVPDADIFPLVAQTLDRKNPREWYWALMDYGTFLKKRHVNPARRSSYYAKQSPFSGSRREVRGAIIRAVTHGGLSSLSGIAGVLKRPQALIRDVAKDLERDGFISIKRDRVSVA